MPFWPAGFFYSRSEAYLKTASKTFFFCRAPPDPPLLRGFSEQPHRLIAVPLECSLGFFSFPASPFSLPRRFLTWLFPDLEKK